MKLYTALTASLIAFCLQNTAFAAVTLTVNTTTDEFGENSANCSLREAIESINTRSAFGGCIAGQRYGTNTIKLEAKEYILTKGELILKEAMTIVGEGTDFEVKDSILGRKPQRHAPTTLLNAQGKSRLFNSATYKADIILNNLKLSNGVSDDVGGAILAGGSVSTSNIIFDNNFAKNNGGAVYLIGNNSGLTSSNTLWKNSQVSQGTGAALGMSCFDDLKLTERTVDIIQSSFIQNGNTNAKSVIEACGFLHLTIKASTIGENTAANLGAILNFNENTSNFSSINIEYSTLVKNTVAPVINFNKISLISIDSSVLAFNEGASCIGNDNNNVTYLGNHNLYQNCSFLQQIPVSSTSTSSSTDTYFPSPLPVQFSDEFNPLGNYGGYTPTYLPKKTSTYVLNKGGECLDRVDQRSSTYSSTIVCDLGAVERRIALAVVDNNSILTNTKPDRIAEVSVLDNDIPSETDLTDDQPNARGQIAKDADGKYLVELTNDGNGFCSIVHRTSEDLLPLIRFDSGGQLLTDAQRVSCKYTFTDTNGIKALEGELLFRIDNKPPIAGNDTYLLASESSSLTMNVVINDNDDADGKYGSLCTSNSTKCNGGYYIRIVSNPNLGTIEGNRRECPDYTDLNKFLCYRGDLIYHPKNTLSPFNDSFTYVVYDDDLDISNAATVTIINQNGQQNNSQSSGSLGWASVLVLAGFAVYRRRKYRFV